MANLNDTLNARGSTYGEFASQAKITQAIKRIVRDSPNRDKLTDLQTEALEMIASKIARILNGDTNHLDSWHDISGYATLAENDLPGQQVLPQAANVAAAPVRNATVSIKAAEDHSEVTHLGGDDHPEIVADPVAPSSPTLPGGPVASNG